MPRPPAANRADLLRLVAAIFSQGFGLSAVVPLFPIYSERFGLSNADLTLVFAIYALALIPALLVVGPRSDVVGRKPVLLPAMAVFAAASLVFAGAQSLTWLLAARMLQGVSNGMFWGAGAAWVRDLTPDERREDASLLVSTTFPGSVAAGALTFGALASITGSIVLPWLVHVGLVAAAAALVSATRETVERQEGPREGRALVRLPEGREAAFLGFVGPVTFALIATGATVMALTPAMLVEVGTGSAAALSGVGVALLIAVSSVVQPFVRRVPAYRTTFWGAVVSVGGLALVTTGVASHSTPLLLVSLLVLGVGNGFCFKGTLALAERLARPHERSAVISAYNIAMYSGFSLPALAAGYASEWAGLTTTLAGLAVGVTAVIVAAFWYGRGRLPHGLRPVEEPA